MRRVCENRRPSIQVFGQRRQNAERHAVFEHFLGFLGR
jgi:hypothetical protein